MNRRTLNTIISVLLIVFAVLWSLYGRPSTPSGPVGVGPAGLPNPALTPGDVLTTNTRKICQPGYTRAVRDVPQSLKNQVYRAYGITDRQPGEYEVDHLISLELGGSNSIQNLWPQSYVTAPLNAHVKDALENKLHDLACKGQITMQQAQQAIAGDWTAAYTRYIGPLPTR
jgi:hypothetical protein